MFENVSPTPPPAVTPPVQPNVLQKKPQPFGQPKPTPVPLADQANIELFKRTSLNSRQKIGLIVVCFLVLGSFIGVGIWLFIALEPFAAPTTSRTNNTNKANNSGIALQDLDSDKDGLRDIDERKYGSDANKLDTDEDGLNDYAEVMQYKSNPTLQDTDGDGYKDNDEVINGYNPIGPGRL